VVNLFVSSFTVTVFSSLQSGLDYLLTKDLTVDIFKVVITFHCCPQYHWLFSVYMHIRYVWYT